MHPTLLLEKPPQATLYQAVLLDQTTLPARVQCRYVSTLVEMIEAIQTMVVRGAPAIGVSAAFGLVLSVQAHLNAGLSGESLTQAVLADAALLRQARPTAVNLMWAVDRCVATFLAASETLQNQALLAHIVQYAQAMHQADIDTNRAMGQHGAAALLRHRPITGTLNIITHCNTGALATAGFGTALGVVRTLHEQGVPVHVFADETRPRLQGAKLTAWECQQLGIPVTLLCDNMAAWRMQQGDIHAVIVGADRIARNGDTANKIGTYGLAVLAKAHNIPFYVAAPSSTIDQATATGAHIDIEQRDAREVSHWEGAPVAPEGVACWNPAFDVTPARLITALITQHGVFAPAEILKENIT